MSVCSFRTRYDEHKRVHAAVGSREHQLYSARFNEDGVIELRPNGVENIYDRIQSHRLSVDINYILERFAAGDVDALSKHQGSYGDFTVMPKTYAEMLNQVIAGEETFNKLPLEVRAKFGHSFSQWISSAGTPEWNDAMGIKLPEAPTVEEKVPDAVKENTPQEVL